MMVKQEHNDSNRPQVHRVEIRFDFVGSTREAWAEAEKVAGMVGGEVTAVFDEDWNEVY